MKAVQDWCTRTTLLVVLLATLPATAMPRPAGPDRQVGDRATWSTVAVAADGGGALAWVEPDADGVEAVWTRPVAPDGTPLGPVVRAGDHRLSWDLSSRDRPVIALAADGGWVVAWTAPVGNRASAVEARVFAPGGQPAGPAFRVSGNVAAAGPALAVAPEGDFVVAWTADADAASVTDVFARRFAAAGTPMAPAFRVNGETTLRQELGGVALARDGSLAVVYDTVRGGSLQGDVLFALFAADGTLRVVDRQVNGDPAAVDADQWESTLAVLDDGRYLVAFRSFGQTPSGGAVVGRFLSAAGEPEGTDFVISAHRPGHQGEPVVAGLPDGGFVALWSDRCNDFDFSPSAPDCRRPENHRDGHFAGVYGRLFDTSGRPRGDDFRVNATTTGHQFAPAVAAGPGGHVLAAWTTNADRIWGSPTSAWWRRFEEPCSDEPHRLCLAGGRFVAEVEWSDFDGGRGRGVAVPRDDGWGYFWFFDPGNVELSVKLLDGRAVNGHHWVFFGALSNVDYTLSVTDRETGAVRRYHNPAGSFASRGDTAAFADPAPVSPTESARVPGDVGAAPPVAAPADLVGSCLPSPSRLCLEGGRFAAEIRWRDPSGNSGWGGASGLTSDTGTFWFFTRDNPEVFVKLLDARAVNGHQWVFYGSLTNVGFTLTVTDTATGQSAVYVNPQGHFASHGDTAAFPRP